MKTILILLLTINFGFSQEQVGIASHYSIRTNGGTHTASGEVLSNHKFTAAHKTLPMGSLVRVKNLKNNKEILVRLNDRGPYIKGRIIDVSQASAHALGFHKDGITKVKIKVVNPPKAIPVKEPLDEAVGPLEWLKTGIRYIYRRK